MFDILNDKACWESFFEHKLKNEKPDSREMIELRKFIDENRFLVWSKRLANGEKLSHPKKKLINKTSANKKRVVYVFPNEENIILKYVSYTLRNYDGIFAPNLYSFRKNKTVKKAIERITSTYNVDKKYVYKVDISSYFNSVNVEKILPILEEYLSEDSELFLFLKNLLLDPYVLFEGELLAEEKGILPGVPVSSFLANLYLKDLDCYFFNNNIMYARYSDDIIVFADSKEEIERYAEYIRLCLKEKGLKINPEKEVYTAPFEKWEFLGFSYQNGVIDVSDVAFKKIKAKMHRKRDALIRWADKKGLPGEYAAKAFVKRFNAKIFDNPIHNELTWARWYFPIINTTETLEKIDEYMQYSIRVLVTGKRTKSRFDCKYEDIKKLGYRNLVNEYYKCKGLNKSKLSD